MAVAIRGHGMGSSIDFDGAPSQSSKSLRMVVPEQGITDAFTFCVIRMPQNEDIKKGRGRCTDPLRSEGGRDHSHMLVGALLAGQCATGFSLKSLGGLCVLHDKVKPGQHSSRLAINVWLANQRLRLEEL